MSVEELSKLTFKLVSEIQDLRIKCIPRDIKVKTDRYGRNVVIMFAECKEHGMVALTYSPMKIKLLIDAMRKLGLADLRYRCLEFERTKILKPRQDYTDPYPVYIPVKIVDCKEIESK